MFVLLACSKKLILILKLKLKQPPHPLGSWENQMYMLVVNIVLEL